MTGEKSLIISCGGTGGHFFPGLSIARTMQKKGGRVLLLISGVNSVSQCSTAGKYGINAAALPFMPSPSLRHPLRSLKFFCGLVSGFFVSLYRIKKFAPQAVLGMGSFASVPVLLAAAALRCPVFLHDGNARIGRGNRIASRIARRAGTAFPAVNADKMHCPCQVTGMPVRPELLESGAMSKADAIAGLNRLYGAALRPELTTILVFGGSQGAASLNKNIPEGLLSLGRDSFQVLHLAGAGKTDEVKAIYSGAAFPVLVLPGTDAMELFYRASDLVFSRSGGSTLAELFFFGKPAVLIPYPYAAEGHQWDNARYAVSCNAAVAVDNSRCVPDKIRELAADFLDDPSAWQLRSRNAADQALPEASENVLAQISG